MADAFNPYRVWLGVAADSQPPTHYELLGLNPAQPDAQLVAEAFRRQMGRLNPHLSGEHAANAQRIANELAEARVVLLTPTSKRAYDAGLAALNRGPSGPSSAPPKNSAADSLLPPAAEPVATLVTPPTTSPPANQPPPPSAPVAPYPTAVYPTAPMTAAYAPPQAAPVGYPNAPGAPCNPPYPVQGYPAQGAFAGQQPFLGQPAHAVQTMPIAAPYSTTAPYPAMAPAAARPLEVPGPAVSTDRTSSSIARGKRSSAGPLLVGMLVAGISTVGGVIYFVKAQSTQPVAVRGAPGDGSPAQAPSPSPRATERATGAPRATKRTPSKQPTASVPKKRSDDSTEKLFTDDPAASPAAPEATMPEPAPEAVKTPSPPASLPKPAAVPPEGTKTDVPGASPEEAAAVDKLLSAARAALADRNFSDAADHLDQATLEAISPDSLAKIERLELLAHYVNDFWNAVREQLTKLDSAETINVNGEELNIIEASTEKIIFRAAGRRYEYAVGKLPGKLAFWLADSWLDKSNPASLIVLGAYHAIDAKGDRQQARRLFEQAGAQGLDVRLLLAELDAAADGGTPKDATAKSATAKSAGPDDN